MNTLTRSARPARSLARDVASLLDDDFWRIPWASPFATRTFPAVNVWTDEEAFFVEAEVPGLDLKDFNLSVTGNELTLEGERQDLIEEGVTYHRRERGLGRFSRVIHLPTAVEPEGVEAQLKDGVLTITLPKAASVRPRRIEVRCSS
jgi:HSP20 family protein